MTGWKTIEATGKPLLESFLAATDTPRQHQEAVLAEILRQNTRCPFGQQHSFANLNGADDFRNKTPIRNYEDIREIACRTDDDGKIPLCDEPLVLYEATSGSSGKPKYIPYTSTSLAKFRDALLPWLLSTLQARPSIAGGSTYWAFSPALTGGRYEIGGIPVGVENDAIYLGAELAPAFLSLSAVSPHISGVGDFDSWRYATALSLLRAERLSLISIWSPTFLFPILDLIRDEADSLIRDIHDGTFSVSSGFPAAPANPERAALIGKLLGREDRLGHIWPGLDTISCWSHAHAATYIPRLRQEFPDCYIQGKGLLSTEAVVTIPFEPHPYPVLALNAGFFEFIHQDQSYLCDELEEGRIYRVIITGFNGLYRYDSGDLVRLRGWARPGLPMLEFVGRATRQSDLCGEKLTEEFVLDSLSVFSGFAALTTGNGSLPGYRLLLDSNEYSDAGSQGACDRVDARLRRNPHYDYARNLGQMAAPVAVRLDDPLGSYHSISLAAGKKFGDVKPPALMTGKEFEELCSYIQRTSANGNLQCVSS